MGVRRPVTTLIFVWGRGKVVDWTTVNLPRRITYAVASLPPCTSPAPSSSWVHFVTVIGPESSLKI